MYKLLFLLLLSSCSFLISKIETPITIDEDLASKAPQIQNYCQTEERPALQIVGPSGNSQDVYFKLVKNLPKLDFIDHFALWNLFQLSVRPDQSSPSSRLQVLVHQGERTYYFDFFSEEENDQYPFIYGIEWVLKKFNKKRTLEYYAAILNRNLQQNLKIGKDFESFLIKNIREIKASPELAPYYFRGTDALKENETSPTLNYQEVVKIYRSAEKKQKIIINTSLTPFVTDKGNSGNCNYDFNLYDNSIFLIDKVIPIANLYGLSLPESGFLASSSQKLTSIRPLGNLPLFRGVSKVRSSAVCMIENNNNKIWAFSNQSRDPGQHLFHLVRYGLPQAETTAEVDKLIRHSRHLFLSDPVRLIIESGRSSDEQVENLLKLNLPIYNADKLGNIWAYTRFKDGGRFIIDDRNPGVFKCQ